MDSDDVNRIYNLLGDLKTDLSGDIKDLQVSVNGNFSELKKQQKELDQRVQSLEKYKWIMTGIGIVVSFLATSAAGYILLFE